MTDKEKTMDSLRMVLRELPKLAEQIPSIKEDFNMKRYGCYEGLEKNKLHMCGTSGCLLGNIARLFPVKDCYFEYREFSYQKFRQIEFPYIDYDDYWSMYSDWGFLFDSTWSKYQPTFDQAIRRLEYFIKCDGILPDWNYQKEDFV